MEASIALNEEQKSALVQMAGFCKDLIQGLLEPDQRMMAFSGPAGTGKTTTLMEMMERLPEGIPVYLCAMTNRAAKNLGDDVPTIYRQLGLYITMNESTGEYDIAQRPNWVPLKNSVIVVDEASMLTQALMNYIRYFTETHNMGFIFVGDRYQLPAVGEPCDVFDGRMPVVELDTIMRQEADNPIQAWGRYLRECIKSGAPVGPLEPHTKEGKGLHNISREMAYEMMTLGAEMGTGEFTVAFTNAVTDAANMMVRKGTFLTRPPMDGELLTVGSAIIVSRRREDGGGFEKIVVATTNSMPVYEIDDWDNRIYEGIYGLGVRVKTDYDDEDCWFDGLIPTDLKKYLETEGRLKQDALDLKMEMNATNDPEEWKELDRNRRAAWGRYYRFKETFFDLRPCFAGTVHKAQGCTFSNVFVDMSDLNIARNVGDPTKREEMYARLLYVAITRARNNVYYYYK